MLSKTDIVNRIKTSSVLKNIYSSFGSGVVKTLGLFEKTDEKLVLFNSFGGKKYDDSPKAIFEAMRNDSRFKDYTFVWAFHNPASFKIDGAKVIKTDTLDYFRTARKAGIWVTNSGIERGMRFKKKETLYFNTWHGTPLKKMGTDVTGEKAKKVPWDIQTAQSEYEAKIFSRVFNIEEDRIKVVGLPRNDILVNNDVETQDKYKKKLGVYGKKVILYAPTFREYERDEKRNCVLDVPLDFKKWEEVLGDEYVVLLRAHYEVANVLLPVGDSSFVINVSDYPNLTDLMLASDMLITDYSSIMFDYSILDRPIVLYTYDYDVYASKRGMYFDVREKLDGGSLSEDKLLELIKNLDYENNINKVRAFRKEYATEYGQATAQSVDILYNALVQNK